MKRDIFAVRLDDVDLDVHVSGNGEILWPQQGCEVDGVVFGQQVSRQANIRDADGGRGCEIGHPERVDVCKLYLAGPLAELIGRHIANVKETGSRLACKSNSVIIQWPAWILRRKQPCTHHLDWLGRPAGRERGRRPETSTCSS